MGKKSPRHSKTSSRDAFSARLLKLLTKSRIPFRVGGTCAMNIYVDMERQTKDLDIFCRAGDYPAILQAAAASGFETEIEDERWIAKIRQGKHFCDVIFGSANTAAPITDDWFVEIHTATLWTVKVKLLPPTELLWSKAFILDRYKCDANDVAHVILKQSRLINWRRLLAHMDLHWEVLLVHLLYFRYVYPSERHLIPAWLMDQLLKRLQVQRKLPAPQTRVCRGRIFSRDDYMIDIDEWGFADLVGDHRIDDGKRQKIEGRRSRRPARTQRA